MTSRQFAEWIAAYNLEPFGEEITRITIARVGSALWNQQRGRGVEALEANDFLPQHQPQQSVEEMKLALRRHISSGSG